MVCSLQMKRFTVSKITVKIILGLAIGELALTVIFHALGSGSFGNYSILSNYIFAGLLFILFYWLNARLPATARKYRLSWIHLVNLCLMTILMYYYLKFSKYILRYYLPSLSLFKNHGMTLFGFSIYMMNIVVPLIIILVDLKFILKTIPMTVWGITLFILLFYFICFLSMTFNWGIF